MYRHSSVLILRRRGEEALLILSREGVTQGDPLTMILFNRLKVCVIILKRHVLDNKCSAKFKKAIKDNEMIYQLLLVDDHHKNIAER